MCRGAKPLRRHLRGPASRREELRELRQPLPGATATARLWGAGFERNWRWVGDVPPDSCVRIGTLRDTVPDCPGPLALELELLAGDVRATNRYTSTVAPR